MANVTISADRFGAVLAKLIDEYGNEVNKICRSVVRDVAQDSVTELKGSSPKRTGAYAKSWAVKSETVAGWKTSYIVHNKEHYQLTHLLENGHEIKNRKSGPSYGTATPHPHIKAVEQKAAKNLEQKIREEIEG